MKILVCTDGSEHSQKVLEAASKTANGCDVAEVAVIHVYDDTPGSRLYATTKEDIVRLNKLEENLKEERKKILSNALNFFQKENIEAYAIFEKGHPSETINRIASEKEVDMIVIGSRGLGGLKKLYLGSVSSAVIQEANCNVLIVK